jgi:hypothetical protein
MDVALKEVEKPSSPNPHNSRGKVTFLRAEEESHAEARSTQKKKFDSLSPRSPRLCVSILFFRVLSVFDSRQIG